MRMRDEAFAVLYSSLMQMMLEICMSSSEALMIQGTAPTSRLSGGVWVGEGGRWVWHVGRQQVWYSTEVVKYY